MIRRLLTLALLAPTLAWATYNSVITGDSPCNWYHMDAPSGTTETDVGVSGGICDTLSNGTYSGTSFTLNATGITGASPDKAVTFSASGGNFITGSTNDFHPDFTNTNGWAFEGWFNQSALASKNMFTGCSAFTSNANCNWFLNSNTDGSFTLRIVSNACQSGGYSTLGSVGSSSAGTYVYVVGTTVGAGSATLSDLAFYVNASQVGHTTSFSGSACNTNWPTTVATDASSSPSTASWNGTADEIAFYRKSGAAGLTGTQITNHYNAGITAPTAHHSVPYIVQAPSLPRFREGNYFTKMVAKGLNTGQIDLTAYQPQYMMLGYLPFMITPRADLR